VRQGFSLAAEYTDEQIKVFNEKLTAGLIYMKTRSEVDQKAGEYQNSDILLKLVVVSLIFLPL
jgi:hypothetical protein